ncbi:hypothetical protein scyTo_0023956, partial [Scyliorhinus torazame]|nr:hypothetical protein [Scyliorhinus torazame]
MASSPHSETENMTSARLNQGLSGCKKTDQSPVVSPSNSSPDAACT